MKAGAIALALVMLTACSTTNSKRAPDAEIARVNTQLALQYLQRGELETAVNKLKIALDADSSRAEIHAAAGLIYEQVGKFAEAEDHFQQAIATAKADSDEAGSAYNNYGVFLCNRGRVVDAVDNFKHAFSNMFYKSPEQAYQNAGVCLAQQEGRNAQAEEHLRKALALNANLPVALIALAEVQFAQKQYLSARAFVQRAHGVSVPSATSLWLAYRIERQLGDSKAAMDSAARLRRQFPDTPQARQLKESLSLQEVSIK